MVMFFSEPLHLAGWPEEWTNSRALTPMVNLPCFRQLLMISFIHKVYANAYMLCKFGDFGKFLNQCTASNRDFRPECAIHDGAPRRCACHRGTIPPSSFIAPHVPAARTQSFPPRTPGFPSTRPQVPPSSSYEEQRLYKPHHETDQLPECLTQI